jgi:hypothetical protein
MANKVKSHTLKMRLATIEIKLMDVNHRADRLMSQRTALLELQTAIRSQLEALLAGETSANAAVDAVPQEPA